MKKLLSSRIGQVAICTVVVLVCLAAMTKWATGIILKHESIQKYIADRQAKAMTDANETNVEPPKNLSNATETKDQQTYEEEKDDQDEQIVNAFQTLNDITSPGEMDFTNPKLAILMAEMRSRWDYVRKREAELTELETHLTEQLQALHWHTNSLTRNRNELNLLFDGRVNLIRQEEEARLREMAKIYETLLLPDQPDGPAVIQQILRANINQDPVLNGKVFQYIAPTNQALIIRTLLSGDTADPELYQNVIQNHRKTIKETVLEPK